MIQYSASMGTQPEPLEVHEVEAHTLDETPIEIVERAAPSPPETLASGPVDIISGVGRTVLEILETLEQPVTTIAEIAALDADTVASSRSSERLMGLRTTAEIILNLDINVVAFEDLSNESLERIIEHSTSELAEMTGQGNAAEYGG